MKKLHRMTTKNTGCRRAYHHKNNYLHISNVVVVATSGYIGALDHKIQNQKGDNSSSSNATLRSVGRRKPRLDLCAVRPRTRKRS